MAEKINMKKQVKKPKVVLMDVANTVTQSTFLPSLLVPYFQKNHKPFLQNTIDEPLVRDVVDKLRTAANLDSGAPKIVPNDSDKATLIASVVAYVDHCLNNNKENKPLALFRFMVWFDGYDRNLIDTPVYADVARQLKKWRLEQNIQLFVLSNGWSVATKKFLEKTTQGNLSVLIQGYMDTDVGPLNSAATFQKVLDQLKQKPEDVCFLSKSVEEAIIAREMGITCILVFTHKKDMESANKVDIPHVRTFEEIEFV